MDNLSVLLERNLQSFSTMGTREAADYLFIYKITDVYPKFCERTFEEESEPHTIVFLLLRLFILLLFGMPHKKKLLKIRSKTGPFTLNFSKKFFLIIS